MTLAEIENLILWFEALADSLDEGDTESAKRATEGALKLLRKQRSEKLK